MVRMLAAAVAAGGGGDGGFLHNCRNKYPVVASTNPPGP